MFKCLRSGACCTKYEVRGVIGYKNGIKPESEPCKHLIPPKYNEIKRRWHKAFCKIHDTDDYPEECKIFIIPGENFNCGLGVSEWKEKYHVVEIDSLID
ncbi:MAG: hypothetical protein D3910_25700 [Candidatus Electrothrix sp. ATG2]|nr:hypothetical protein [Candidatus Electrothrix sp. ATG2]